MFNNSPWEKKNTFHHILETDSQALPSPERCTLFILSVVEKKFNMGNGCLKTVGWQMTNSFFRELFKLVTFLPNKHKYPDKLNWTKTEEQRSLYILFILKHIVSMRFAKLGQFSYIIHLYNLWEKHYSPVWFILMIDIFWSGKSKVLSV